MFPCRFWSRNVSHDSLRVEAKMTGIHWCNFVFLCLTDLLIIFSLNTLAFVHRSLEFRGILKNQNLLGFEVLASFPGAYSPAVPTHWALGSSGNKGFRIVFKFCSATSSWYHLEPLTWSLYFHYSTYKREQWSRRNKAAMCRITGDIWQYWKVGDPYVILLFLSIFFCFIPVTT